MKHLKSFNEGVFTLYDEEILEYFVDLDEIFDVDISSNNGTVEFKFQKEKDTQGAFLEIFNRIERMRGIGEFVTNSIWSENKYGRCLFNLVNFDSILNSDKYQFTIGDKELLDFDETLRILARNLKIDIRNRSYAIGLHSNADLSVKLNSIDWIRENLTTRKIQIEVKPNKPCDLSLLMKKYSRE
jgi:hypothetical protein